MLLQALALAVLAISQGDPVAAAASAVALGAGTALVYPTLIAAISDSVSPIARAPTVGVYRFWRDMGYVAGGLIAGIGADALGFAGAIGVVAALTAASGLWVAIDLPTRRANSVPPAQTDEREPRRNSVTTTIASPRHRRRRRA
jgi:MFS family permease